MLIVTLGVHQIENTSNPGVGTVTFTAIQLVDEFLHYVAPPNEFEDRLGTERIVAVEAK